jgi:CHAD domain-containing protein
MTYHLDIGGSLEGSVANVVKDQAEKAIASLNNADEDLEEAVHDARKRFKKLRALARLIRPGLGDRYAELNSVFRDLGRELSDIRDAQVLVETYDKLVASVAGQDIHARWIEGVGEWVKANRETVLAKKSAAKRVANVRREVERLLTEMSAWELDGGPARILQKGLKKTYKRGRKALSAASVDPDVGRLHEWRKRAKYHWYHCRLLREAWPPILVARANELDRLGDLLGDEHDLAVLNETLHIHGSSDLDPAHVKMVENLARRRQQSLRVEAFQLGPRVFQETPCEHAGRIVGYWNDARAALA